MFMTSKLVFIWTWSWSGNIPSIIYFDLLFFELNNYFSKNSINFDWNWTDPANGVIIKIRKCAISAGKLLVSYVLYSK